MARRNGCTGEVEYPNGCTRFGYACSTLLALVSCVGVPLVHHLCFSNAPPAPLAPCLARHGLTPEAHAEEMAMYFRYRVEPAVTCTVETRILRGCVDDPTPVIGFQRYPPGPLRAKNARDVRDAFARVPRAFLDAADQERAATAEASSHNDDEDPTAVCSTAARALAATLPRLTSPPYDVSLADVYPFSALAADASGAPARLSYVEYACLAAVERAVELILQARGESSRGAAGALEAAAEDPPPGATTTTDLTAELAAFFGRGTGGGLRATSRRKSTGAPGRRTRARGGRREATSASASATSWSSRTSREEEKRERTSDLSIDPVVSIETSYARTRTYRGTTPFETRPPALR